MNTATPSRAPLRSILGCVVSLSAACASTSSARRPRTAATSSSALCEAARGDDPASFRFGPMLMLEVCPGTYIDPDSTAVQRVRLAHDYDEAARHVEDSLGPLRAPRAAVLFCATSTCVHYFAGSVPVSRELAPHTSAPGGGYVAGDRAALLITDAGPRAKNLVAHELVHAELRFRLRGARVPIWFHEGVAASIGDEPVCPEHLARGIDDLRRLDGERAWAEQTSGDLGRETYCQARAEVEAWGARDGRRRLQALVEAVAAGASFDAAYGPMRTQ